MTGRSTVVILQEYIPTYRVAFFNALVAAGDRDGITIRIGHGLPHGSQAERGDTAEIAASFTLRQREVNVAGRRVVVRRLPRCCRSADLVIMEQARRNLDAYRLLLPRWLRRAKKIALWGHGRDYVKSPSRSERLAQRILTNRADWFFGYTASGVRHVVEQGFRPGRTTVVQNSTDTRRLIAEIADLGQCERERFIARHDLKGRTALYIGGLDESKLIPLLLEAAEIRHSTDRAFRLLVGGTGELRDLVQRATHESDCISYLGVLDDRAKALAMSCAEVLAIPGRVGLVAVDSIASGVPIVTTDWDLHAPEYEYLDQDTHVRTLQQPQAYADALAALLNDRECLGRMRMILLARRDHFGVEIMADNFLRGIVQALEDSA